MSLAIGFEKTKVTNAMLEWLRSNYSHLHVPIQAKDVQNELQAHFQTAISMSTICRVLRLGLGFSYRKIYA